MQGCSVATESGSPELEKEVKVMSGLRLPSLCTAGLPKVTVSLEPPRENLTWDMRTLAPDTQLSAVRPSPFRHSDGSL